jgi:hypothetical protein
MFLTSLLMDQAIALRTGVVIVKGILSTVRGLCFPHLYFDEPAYILTNCSRCMWVGQCLVEESHYEPASLSRQGGVEDAVNHQHR